MSTHIQQLQQEISDLTTERNTLVSQIQQIDIDLDRKIRMLNVWNIVITDQGLIDNLRAELALLP